MRVQLRTLSLVLTIVVGCAAGSDREPTSSSVRDDAGASIDSGVGPVADDSGGGLSEVVVPTVNDHDGDGYDVGDDCDDGNPAINPGAIEVPGDGVDNDCNGKIDEPPVDCDRDLALASSDAMDFARSLGLCQTADLGAKGKARRWGVLQASIGTITGGGAPLARQYGIEKRFGEEVGARAGESMVVLSSGVARTPGQPDFVKLPKGEDSTKNAHTPPEGWPRNTKGCPSSKTKLAFDSVVLDLTIRVPTNAKAFSYDFDFYSSEYVEYVCQAYNDTFVALLDSKVKLDPLASGNISFDGNGDPINVNSGYFQVCKPDSWLGRAFDCPLGVGELKGTGFDAIEKTLTNPAQNGATSWLRTRQEVVGGDEIHLRFAIWNTGDHWLPSTVLLDKFEWSAEKTKGSVTDRPK